MSNRYWVGGTDNWDATAGTKWALTSGGAGGEAVPTDADDVFFDAASGTVTVTVTTTRNCLSFNGTGFTGTLAMGSGVHLNIYANLTLGSGMTIGGNNSYIFLYAPSGSFNITSNEVIIDCMVYTGGAATYILQDNFSITQDFYHEYGTFNANNFNVTCRSFSSPYASTRAITMGSGTWTLTGTGTIWDLTTTTNLTLNCNTSTIKITNTSNTASTFEGGGQTYNNIWFSRGTSTAINTISGSNTFNNLKDDGTEAHTIKFTDGTDQTVTSLTIAGSAGKLISLLGTSTAGWTISCASGTITVDYCDIDYSTAEGGATFNATNSTDGGHNTGWNFLTDLSVNVSDQLNITENNTFFFDLWLISIFDSINIIEDITIFITEYYVNIFDQSNITENITMAIDPPVNIFDLTTISENVVMENSQLGGINVSDALNITDNFTSSEQSSISVNDTIIISENITVEIPLLGGINVSDTLNITDNFTPLLELYVSVNDNINVADCFARTYDDSGFTYDSLIPYDGFFVPLELISYINVSDQLNITENLTEFAFVRYINVSDSVTISENIARLEFIYVSVSDQLNITENIAEYIDLRLVSVFDSISITENFVPLSLFFVSVNDTLVISESVLEYVQLGDISVSDSITVSENLNLLNQLHISVNDAITVSENFTKLTFIYVNVSDVLTITENIVMAGLLYSNVNDVLNITEYSKEEFYSFISITEVIPVTMTEAITTESFRFSPSVVRPVGRGFTISPVGIMREIKPVGGVNIDR